MNDLRLELRVKNRRLWEAIHETHASVAAFCRAMGFPRRNQTVGELLSLRASPYTEQGDLTTTAAWLVEATGLGADELFPPHLYANVAHMPKLLVCEVSSERFLPLAAAGGIAAPANMADEYEREETALAVREAVKDLPPRFAHVLGAVFGLGDDEPMTTEQVGRAWGLTPARISRISAEARRRLRRVRKLAALAAHD